MYNTDEIYYLLLGLYDLLFTNVRGCGHNLRRYSVGWNCNGKLFKNKNMNYVFSNKHV